MPLFNKNIFTKDNVAIWKISENLLDLFAIATKRGIIFDEKLFKNEARLKQHLASRILLYNVLGQNQILKNDNGKPHFLDKQVHFSISHDKEFAAIIFGNNFCGIDIQEISEKTKIIKHKYINDEDIHSASENAEELTKIWCAKEALYKIHGDPNIFFKEHLIVKNSDDPTILIGEITHEDYLGKFSLKVRKLENYYLVYTC